MLISHLAPSLPNTIFQQGRTACASMCRYLVRIVKDDIRTRGTSSRGIGLFKKESYSMKRIILAMIVLCAVGRVVPGLRTADRWKHLGPRCRCPGGRDPRRDGHGPQHPDRFRPDRCFRQRRHLPAELRCRLAPTTSLPSSQGFSPSTARVSSSTSRRRRT